MRCSVTFIDAVQPEAIVSAALFLVGEYLECLTDLFEALLVVN